MSRFLIGLLLGALAGIAGTAAFLIVYGGGDYLVSTSPRVRELEATLSRADEDRDWLKARLREATEVTHRLESRFEGLAARFERLSAAAAPSPGAEAPAERTSPDEPSAPSPTPSAATSSAAADAETAGEPADAPEPHAIETPAETPEGDREAIPTMAPADDDAAPL